jgi:hypothetical protein
MRWRHREPVCRVPESLRGKDSSSPMGEPKETADLPILTSGLSPDLGKVSTLEGAAPLVGRQDFHA